MNNNIINDSLASENVDIDKSNILKESLITTNLQNAEKNDINFNNSCVEEIKNNMSLQIGSSKNFIPPKKSKEIHGLLDQVINNYTVSCPENYVMPDDFQQIIDDSHTDVVFAYKLTIPLVNYYFKNLEIEINERVWAAAILVLSNTENKFEINDKILYYLHAKNLHDVLDKVESTLPGWMISHMENDTYYNSYYSVSSTQEQSFSFIKSHLESPYLTHIDIHKNEDQFFKYFYTENTEINNNFINYLINQYKIDATTDIKNLLIDNKDNLIIDNKDNLIIEGSKQIDNLNSNEIPRYINAEEQITPKTLVWFSSQSMQNVEQQIIDCKRTNPEKYEQLKNYLSTLKRDKPILEINDYSIFDSILDKAPNFSEVVKYFKGSFVLNQSRRLLEDSYLVTTPILLLGDPGIGKTYFAKTLAKLLNTSFYFMDANSITANWVLSGGSSQWKSGEAGNIFKFMNSSSTVSPVIIFDEIDKLSSGKNYDTFSVFHQLLEPENARSFQDEFLNISFDASNIIYILTANNVKSIPDSLLSRMKIFDIKIPDKQSTRKIAQNIYSDVIGKSPLFNPILNEEHLILLENLSPRILKKLITQSVFNQAADIIEKVNQELIIHPDYNKEKKWGF